MREKKDLLPHPGIHREADRPKRQSGHRGAPTEEVQEKGKAFLFAGGEADRYIIMSRSTKAQAGLLL
jgi:hypothetical protein